MLSVASPKACFSRAVYKMPDNCAGTQPCFTSLWMSKGSDQLSVKDHSALHVLDRERMMLRSLGGHPSSAESWIGRLCPCLPVRKPSWGLWRLPRVVAVVPYIFNAAVRGRTPYQWLTCWLGNHIAILGRLVLFPLKPIKASSVLYSGE